MRQIRIKEFFMKNKQKPWPNSIPVIAIIVMIGFASTACGEGAGGGGFIDDGIKINTDWYTDDPTAPSFNIGTPEELAGLAEIVNGTWDGTPVSFSFKDKTIVQTKDIDLGGKQWTPIGTEDDPFLGSYDGNGMNISGLKIVNNFADYKGLFGYIGEDGEVDAVTLLNVSISYGEYNGALAGENHGIVHNCTVTGSVSGDRYIGGVTGRNYGIVTGCSFSGSVTSTGNYVGGVVGVNETGSSITNCFATGSVISHSYYAGGVAGRNYSAVERCSAKNSVTANYSNAGGITGINETGSSIANCYTASTVKARVGVSDYAGGITGANKAGSFIANCYATGSVEGSWVGGICFSNDGSITNSIALNTKITGSYNAYRVCNGGTRINNYCSSEIPIDGEKISSDDFRSILNGNHGKNVDAADYNTLSWWTTAANWDTTPWDFDDVWAWGDNNLPKLKWE